MRIVTPDHLDQIAWTGDLEPQGQTFGGVGGTAHVSLGEPRWWPGTQLLAEEGQSSPTPPPSDRQYTLVRLACTLHPLGDSHARYTEATLMAYLRPRQGSDPVIAHDLFPTQRLAEDKRTFTVKLGPKFKFAQSAEVEFGEAGTEIEYVKAFPVIQGFGLGESRPYWQFDHHATAPLLGSQHVYLVVDAPPDSDAVRLSIELTATVETRFGPVSLGPPDTGQAHVSRTIPLGGTND